MTGAIRGGSRLPKCWRRNHKPEPVSLLTRVRDPRRHFFILPKSNRSPGTVARFHLQETAERRPNGEVIEAQAAEAAARAKDETEIEQAQNALRKAELEMQKIELKSRIDAEKIQEDLNEAKATLAELKETFDLKRRTAQASIRVLEIQRDRTRETMVHAQTNAALMEIQKSRR